MPTLSPAPFRRLNRRTIAVLASTTLIAVLFAPASVLAGGWLVMTLDSLPGELRAGESTTLGFVMRQHGVNPLDRVETTATFIHSESGRQVTLAATNEGAKGQYLLCFTPPIAGTWDWSIEAWNSKHPMPSLQVAPAAAAPATPLTPAVGLPASLLAPDRWSLIAGGMLLIVLGLMGFGSAMVVRRTGGRRTTTQRLGQHPATERGSTAR